MKIYVGCCGAIFLFMAFSVKGANQTTENQQPVAVVSSIITLDHFVQKIGAGWIRSSVLVGEGGAPETYEPTPRQLTQIARAEVLFSIGVPFESQLVAKVKNVFPAVKIVDVSLKIKKRYFLQDHLPHNHHGHPEGSKTIDPHIWLNPQIVGQLVAKIYQVLSNLRPELQPIFKTNLLAFQQELTQLHHQLQRKLRPFKNRRLYVNHPAFGYFCDAYQLIQVSIERDGKQPSAKWLTQFISQAKSDQQQTIFVQSQFSTASAEVLAKAIQGRVQQINPLPADYVLGMRELGDAIGQSFSTPNKQVANGK